MTTTPKSGLGGDETYRFKNGSVLRRYVIDPHNNEDFSAVVDPNGNFMLHADFERYVREILTPSKPTGGDEMRDLVAVARSILERNDIADLVTSGLYGRLAMAIEVIDSLTPSKPDEPNMLATCQPHASEPRGQSSEWCPACNSSKCRHAEEGQSSEWSLQASRDIGHACELASSMLTSKPSQSDDDAGEIECGMPQITGNCDPCCRLLDQIESLTQKLSDAEKSRDSFRQDLNTVAKLAKELQASNARLIEQRDFWIDYYTRRLIERGETVRYSYADDMKRRDNEALAKEKQR